jgi:hypothetical protein
MRHSFKLLLVVVALCVGQQLEFVHLFGNMLAGNHQAHKLPYSVNGGTKCAGCTIVLSIVESLSSFHKTTIEQEIELLCKRLPAILREPCDDFVTEV